MLMGLVEGSIQSTPAATTFVGPADVSGWSSGIYAFYSLRAMNASLASTATALVDLQRSSDSATMTLFATTNGYPDISTGSSYNIFTSSGTTAITAIKFYDQSGNSRHLGTGGGGGFPLFTNAAINSSLPSLTFTSTTVSGGLILIASAANSPLAQPITVAGIVRFSGLGEVFTDGSFSFQPMVSLSSVSVSMQAGGGRVDYTSVNGTFQSIISTVNGSSSQMSINGTLTSGGDPGANSISSANQITMGAGTSGGAAYLSGDVYELFVLAGARSSTQQAALTSNQRGIGSGI